MRAALRYGASAIAGLLLLLFGGLTVFTAETVADEIGWTEIVRSTVRSGWNSVTEAGYAAWLVAATILFVGASAALWADYLLRPKNPFAGTKKKIVKKFAGRLFQNEEVHLDGCSYRECTFRNVKLIHNGGKFELVKNKFSGVVISTESIEISSHVELLAQFHFLKTPIYGNTGELRMDGVSRINDQQ